MLELDQIPGWFPEQSRNALAELIINYDCNTGIEIGCFMGKSSVWLARRLGHLFCVDRWCEWADTPNQNNLVWTLTHWGWPRDFFHVWRDNVIAAGCFERITPIRGDSRDVHPLVTPADIVYIDGDHSYAGCVSDIKLYGGKARKIICGDDYDSVPGFEVIQATNDMLPNVQHDGRFWWHVVNERTRERWQ